MLRCAGLAREKKGFDILALDVREHAGFTDYFLICSGSSDRQVQALSGHIAETLKKGKQAIVLIPEIALTPQTMDRFTGRFGDQVAVLHSRLDPEERA
ncbi:MAG TPA: RsfS/YbeB/iojap family protein, partial [Thermodesulfobacteriota bacterium]|nr:RsfS/YbeB/iojap family protein [Thermodesulfobacteriota bacterium]